MSNEVECCVYNEWTEKVIRDVMAGVFREVVTHLEATPQAEQAVNCPGHYIICPKDFVYCKPRYTS